MRYWIRTTHDFDNETREWKFRESLESIIDDCMIESRSVCGVHAVPRDYWATLWQIAEINRIYYEQWKDDPFSCSIDPSALREDVLLKDLELMEQLGLVKSKVIP